MKNVAKILFVLMVLAVFTITGIALSLPGVLALAAPPLVESAQVISLSADLPQLVDEGALIKAGGLTLGPNSLLLQDGPGDKVVLGGAFVLQEGETLEGSLFVLGGTATIEKGSLVEGDVLLLGGSVSVSGQVKGNIVAIGGFADLSESALVEGDVNAIGGHVTYANRESILGEFNTGLPGGQIVIPGGITIPEVPGVGIQPNFFSGWMNLVMGLVWWMLRAFLWAVLAVLVVLFLPRNTERTSKVVTTQPLIAGGLGLLTVFVAPLLLLLIAITIIGIPVSLLGLFALVVAWAFGLVAIGTEIGKRLAHALNQEWALPVSAALGTLFLMLIINGIDQLIPCIGWMIPALVGMIGLGAVLLTVFGSRDYPAAPVGITAVQPVPPSPPAAPMPPIAAPEPSTKVAVEPEEMDAAPIEEPQAEEEVVSEAGDQKAVSAPDTPVEGGESGSQEEEA